LTNCTYTEGYWANHGTGDCASGNNTNAWPVDSLALGNNTYSAAQLCAILNTPVRGNGLTKLAQQLITAKLDIANGADPSAIQSSIDAADAMIGNLIVGSDTLPTSQTSVLVNTIDNWNNGITGPGHCTSPTTAAEEEPWPTTNPTPTP
jgi:hypothetical protein